MDTPERIAKLEAQVDAIKDDVAELKADVKEIHSRITTGNRELMDKIGSIEEAMRQNALSATEQHLEIEKAVKKDIDVLFERFAMIEKWKWMIVGGAVVAGYILGNLDPLAKIFGH